ncbi:MAG: riboflavin synthase [Pseudomonadota bacterium]
MFSGIVEESAFVASFRESANEARLVVKSKLDHAKTKLGDSICIDGVCLTVVAHDGKGALSFDLASETIRRSTLGSKKAGDTVNLERSLALGDRLHGHFVFGHVDARVELLSRKSEGTCDRLVWSLPAEFRHMVVSKGSVSLSGVSLTVGEVDDRSFSVYIIPHTSEVTTLHGLSVGAEANFEVDMLSRYVNAALRGERAAGGMSLEFLKAHGYGGKEER